VTLSERDISADLPSQLYYRDNNGNRQIKKSGRAGHIHVAMPPLKQYMQQQPTDASGSSKPLTRTSGPKTQY
jgi:hypothetical protein